MKIGVVGLGLIGGSIFKGLMNKYEVTGVQPSSLPSSTDRGLVTDDFSELKTCNLVFVCTPMGVTLEVLDKLEEYLSCETIVTDVCSLKTFVSKKKYSYRFIPSHPMAGTEHSGWENSFPELFKGAKWVVTPSDGDVPDELETIIKDLGAQIIITTAEEHDKAAALISNLPLFAAQALCENIKDNKLAQVMAASGFRDTTRLALSNTQMASDMLEFNRENIEFASETFKKCLNNLFIEEYKPQAESIKKLRESMFQ